MNNICNDNSNKNNNKYKDIMIVTMLEYNENRCDNDLIVRYSPVGKLFNWRRYITGDVLLWKVVSVVCFHMESY